MSPLLTLLGRGVLAGGLAGAISGTFSYLLAEPVIDRAIELEEAGAAAVPHVAGVEAAQAEVFSRTTQGFGLVVATVLTGMALGVLFAVCYAVLYHKDPYRDSWKRSLQLAGVAFVGLWLLPFLRYPANPPGVGDTATVGMRTAAWLGAIAISLFAVIAAWRVHAHLADRQVSVPVRHLTVTALLTVALAALFALPDNPDPVTAPATLVWDFRLLAVAAAALLFAALGAIFGLQLRPRLVAESYR